MESGLIGFINEYGYLAVFLLVFLQELGVPNPVPNELVLIFGGALTAIGGLNFWLMFLAAVAADAVGTTILFSVFYFFERKIMERIKKWEKINRKLDQVKAKILAKGKPAIFVGRLLPFIRGYVSVAAGILNIPYRVFLPMIVFPALIWSGGYVVLGHFLGTRWESVAKFIHQYQWVLLAVVVLLIAVWVYWRYRKNLKNRLKLIDEKSNLGGDNNFPKDQGGD